MGVGQCCEIFALGSFLGFGILLVDPAVHDTMANGEGQEVSLWSKGPFRKNGTVPLDVGFCCENNLSVL